MSANKLQCTSCGHKKPEDDFYPYRRNVDGLTGRCKQCGQDYCRKWNKDHPEAVVGYVAKARRSDPEKYKKLAQKIYQNMKARGTRGKKPKGRNLLDERNANSKSDTRICSDDSRKTP